VYVLKLEMANFHNRSGGSSAQPLDTMLDTINIHLNNPHGQTQHQPVQIDIEQPERIDPSRVVTAQSYRGITFSIVVSVCQLLSC